ncbi:unnamed protein product, partial [Tilletia controversa]
NPTTTAHPPRAPSPALSNTSRRSSSSSSSASRKAHVRDADENGEEILTPEDVEPAPTPTPQNWHDDEEERTPEVQHESATKQDDKVDSASGPTPTTQEAASASLVEGEAQRQEDEDDFVELAMSDTE